MGKLFNDLIKNIRRDLRQEGAREAALPQATVDSVATGLPPVARGEETALPTIDSVLLELGGVAAKGAISTEIKSRPEKKANVQNAKKKPHKKTQFKKMRTREPARSTTSAKERLVSEYAWTQKKRKNIRD